MSLKVVLPARALASGEVVVGTIEWADYLSITSTVYHNRTVSQVQDLVDAGKEIADKYWARCGQCLDDFKEAYPEYADLLQYHLFHVDGPLHYEDNTVHFAGDRDCWGLRKGEFRAFEPPTWVIPYSIIAQAQRHVRAAECPEPLLLHYERAGRTGEGKARELDLARSAACWPDASDDELSVEPEELKAALQARLPALLARFRADVKAALGWEIP